MIFNESSKKEVPESPSEQDQREKYKDSEHNVYYMELKPEPLMNIKISVGGIITAALLDTGAATNMIRQSVANQIKANIVSDNRKIVGLGNKEIKSAGIINVDFTFYGVRIRNTPFHIVDDSVMKVPIILGRKFCAKSKLIIDMANRSITKIFNDGSRIDIYLDKKDNSLQFSMHENIKVQAAETVKINTGLNKVKVRMEQDINGLNHSQRKHLYFEGKNKINETDCIDGICDIDSEEKFVFINHKSENAATVTEGEKLGDMYTIHEEVDNSEEIDEKEWSIERLNREIDIGSNITKEQKEQVIDILNKNRKAL